MSYLMVLILAVSLSMDAFSLSLAYGTLNLEKKYINILSITVGIYHFIMPLIGLFIGNIILSKLLIEPNTIVFWVLLIIGIEMIIESFKEEKDIKIMRLTEILIFGLAVSIDSFSVGLGLDAIYKYPIISCLTFSISAFTFTYLGLILGKKINNMIGKVSTIIGGITLIIIGIIYLI